MQASPDAERSGIPVALTCAPASRRCALSRYFGREGAVRVGGEPSLRADRPRAGVRGLGAGVGARRRVWRPWAPGRRASRLSGEVVRGFRSVRGDSEGGSSPPLRTARFRSSGGPPPPFSSHGGNGSWGG